jgi:hypothetical protein
MNFAKRTSTSSSGFAVPSGRWIPIVASASSGMYGLTFHTHSTTPAPRAANA